MSNNTKNELKIPNFIKSNKEEYVKFRRHTTEWTFNCKSFNGCKMYDWKNY